MNKIAIMMITALTSISAYADHYVLTGKCEGGYTYKYDMGENPSNDYAFSDNLIILKDGNPEVSVQNTNYKKDWELAYDDRGWGWSTYWPNVNQAGFSYASVPLPENWRSSIITFVNGNFIPHKCSTNVVLVKR